MVGSCTDLWFTFSFWFLSFSELIEELEKSFILRQCGSLRSLCWEAMKTKERRASWMTNQTAFVLSLPCRYCVIHTNFNFKHVGFVAFGFFWNCTGFWVLICTENLWVRRVFDRWSGLYVPGMSIHSPFFFFCFFFSVFNKIVVLNKCVYLHFRV